MGKKRKNQNFIFKLIAVVLLFFISGCGGGGSSSTVPDVISYSPVDFTESTTQKVVELTPDITGITLVNSTVKQMSDIEISKISSISFEKDASDNLTGNATILYQLDTGENLTYAVNDVLVFDDANLNTDEYPVRKVTSINTNNNQVTIGTVDAKMEEIFDSLDIAFTKEVLIEDINTTNYAPGVKRVAGSAEYPIAFDLDKEIYNNGNVVVKCVGNTQMNLKYTYSLGFYNKQLRYLGISLLPSQKTTLGLEATGSWSGSKEVSLGNVVNNKVKFVVPTPIAPIPVWVDIKIPFNIGINGTISGTVETSINREDSAMVGVSYDPDNGWRDRKKYTKITEIKDPTIKADASVLIYAGPKMISELYSVAGPWISMYGALNMKAATEALVDNYPLDYEWELRGGIESKAGIDLSMLSKILSSAVPSLDVELANTSNDGWKIQAGPDIDSVTVSTSEIRIKQGTTLDITNNIQFTGSFLYPEKDLVIPYTDTKLTVNVLNGSINNNIYTAPYNGTTDTMTFKYSYINQYDGSTGIEKEVEVPIVLIENKILSSIAINSSNINIDHDDTYTLTDNIVTATYMDGSTSNVTSLCTFSGTGVSSSLFTPPYDDSIFQITVNYTENSITKIDTFTISVAADPANITVTNTLTHGAFPISVSGGSGSLKYYKIVNPFDSQANFSVNLGIITYSGSGDALIIRKVSSPPTLSDYNQYSSGNPSDSGGEYISFAMEANETQYILIYGQTAYSNLSLNFSSF